MISAELIGDIRENPEFLRVLFDINPTLVLSKIGKDDSSLPIRPWLMYTVAV